MELFENRKFAFQSKKQKILGYPSPLGLWYLFSFACKWHSAKTYKTVAGTGEEDLDTRKGQVMFARTNPPHTKLMVDLIHHVAVKYNSIIDSPRLIKTWNKIYFMCY